MSGGSYDYIYCKLLEECEKRMYDDEMNDLIKDLAEVLHDLEWWQSDDIDEQTYRDTLSRFKRKWFQENREKRLKEYVDKQVSMTKNSLYKLIGVESEEE